MLTVVRDALARLSAAEIAAIELPEPPVRSRSAAERDESAGGGAAEYVWDRTVFRCYRALRAVVGLLAPPVAPARTTTAAAEGDSSGDAAAAAAAACAADEAEAARDDDQAGALPVWRMAVVPWQNAQTGEAGEAPSQAQHVIFRLLDAAALLPPHEDALGQVLGGRAVEPERPAHYVGE